MTTTTFGDSGKTLAQTILNPEPAASIELEVVQTRSLTSEIRHFVLRHSTGGSLPPFEAGAHIDVRVVLDSGVHDMRSYSLINSEETSGRYEIAVKCEKDGRGGSRFMHALGPGRRVLCTAPTNQFALVQGSQHAVLIAGGIGITPILSMARSLHARGTSFEMHYGARHPELMAFQEEVAVAARDRANLYFDAGPSPRKMDLVQVLREQSPQRHLYVCGPTPLLDAVRHFARDSGWADDHVHFEVFGAPARAGDHAVTLVLHKSQRTLDVRATQSILDAMIEAGLEPMFDCKRGQCGACAVKVLAGTPDHRDYALSDSDRHEDSLMCTCVSRCTSSVLTLDA